MDNFKLTTSMSFPYFKLNEDVRYSEVKKPSGIAYILLVLINESKNREEKIEDLLIKFGIPKSLHELFQNTLNNLINEGILITKEDYSNLACPISHYMFTADGKKMFEEEAIPTGRKKEDRISLYYDIASNELMFDIDKDLEPRPLMDSFITPEFVSQFECKKNVESFLNLHKGERWPKLEKGRVVDHLLIKKEEIITEVLEIDARENWLAKQDCDMQISGDDITIKFDDACVQKFFDENYTDTMINEAIGFKNKFKFDSTYAENLKLSEFNSNDINDIVLPSQMSNILSQKFKYSITKGNYVAKNSTNIKSKDGINLVNKNAEFIVLDEKENVYTFVPGKFNLNSEKFGTIILPLTLKLKATKDDLKVATKPYLENLKFYSEDNFRQLVKITNFTGDIDSANVLIRNYFVNDPATNISCLNFIKDAAITNSDIYALYKEILRANYEALITNCNDRNLESVLKITKNTPKTLGYTNDAVLEYFASKLTNISPLYAYETFVENGFNPNVVAVYFNPVIEALKTRDVHETKLNNLINFDNLINSMKSLLNIKDIKSYIIDEEKINKEEFSRDFQSGLNLKKDAEIFKETNKELFAIYDHYLNIFQPINDDINLQIQASKNPDKLTKEMVDKKIAAGDYRGVFADLAVKLEYLLKKLYESNGSGLFELLNSSKGIDKKTLNVLHDFREIRNNSLHFDKESKFDADDLRNWSKAIFDLEVKDV